MLFLTGLLLSFRSLAVRRMRYFLLMCLAVFVVVQALGRTQLSEESPEINSENLLVLLVPLVFIYGVSLFLVLLDQMMLPLRELRFVVKTVFVGLCCVPMIFALLPPKSRPVVYPPYYPPDIQLIAGWMKPDGSIRPLPVNYRFLDQCSIPTHAYSDRRYRTYDCTLAPGY